MDLSSVNMNNWPDVYRAMVGKFSKQYQKGLFITYLLQVHTAGGVQDLLGAVPKILKKLDDALQNEADDHCPPKARKRYEEWKTTLHDGQQNGISNASGSPKN